MRTNYIIHGDVRDQLQVLPDDSIDCVITSPPYFRLRNYGVDAQIGLETTVDGWVQELRTVFAEVQRVLKPSGSVWLNLGDSYSRTDKSGVPPKSLVLAPERLLLGLADDGWLVRNKVIWAKTNPMPASVQDRLSATHEYVYFLTKRPRYYFDLDTVRIPHKTTATEKRSNVKAEYPPARSTPPSWAGPLAGNNTGLSKMKQRGLSGHPLGKNPGDVWRLGTANFRGAHFATFPNALVQRPLLATCPERICTDCGGVWQRSPQRVLGHLALQGQLEPSCTCAAGWKPGVVLDPFFGAGTVGLVAEANQRRWIGIEVSSEFVALAEQRLVAARPPNKSGREAA